MIYWDYLATHWGLSTPSEQLGTYIVTFSFLARGIPTIHRAVCAWRVTFTTNPAQLKKLAKSLSLRIEDLPKPLDPIAVNRFIRIHMVPGARWAAVPVLAVWYLVRSRDAQLAYSKSKYNSKL